MTTAPYIVGDVIEVRRGPEWWTLATVVDVRLAVPQRPFGVRWEFAVRTLGGEERVVHANDDGFNLTIGQQVQPAAVPEEEQCAVA